MSERCDHYWSYEYMIYTGRREGECSIRRWCSKCGEIQHSYTGRWYSSKIGIGKLWGEYPEDYPKEFKKEY